MKTLVVAPHDGICKIDPRHLANSDKKQYVYESKNVISLDKSFKNIKGAERYNEILCGKEVTNSDVTLDYSTKKIGPGSAYFNGSSYLRLNDSDDWNFGSGAFTIDFGFMSGTASTMAIMCQGSVYGTNSQEVLLDLRPAQQRALFVYHVGGSDYGVKTPIGSLIADGKFHHIEIVKNGTSGTLSDWKIFIDGVSQTLSLNTALTASMSDYSGYLNVGASVTPSDYFTGFIDELRISKGVARHSANFTPPTSPYLTDSYTKLLLHFDGDFYDYAGTPDGSTKWVKRIYWKSGGQTVRKQFAVINGKIFKGNDSGKYFDQCKINDSLDITLQDQYPSDTTIKVSETFTTYLCDGKNLFKFTPNDAGQWDKLGDITDVDGNIVEFEDIIEYLDRLWVIPKDRNVILHSKNLEPENLSDSTDAGLLDLPAGNGGYPRKFILHRGFLYVVHEDYFVPVTGSSTSTFGVKPGDVIYGYGTRAKRSVVGLKTAFAFLNSYDNEWYMTGGTLDSTTQTPFSQLIGFRDLVNRVMADQTVAFLDQKLNCIRISYVGDGESSLNKEIIYSLEEKKWCGETEGRHISCYCQWTGDGDNTELITGRSDMAALMINDTGWDFDGEPIRIKWVTSDYLLSRQSPVQLVDFYLDAKATGNYTIPVGYFVDSRLTYTGAEEISVYGEQYGSFSIGLAEQITLINRGLFKIDKSKARTLRFEIDFGDPGMEFEWYAIEVNFNPSLKAFSKTIAGI